MHIDKFMPLLLRHVLIVSNLGDHLPVTWQTYGEYAELTALIDYKCGFDKSVGTCRKYARRVRLKRTDWDYKTRARAAKACCSNCANSMGYLDFVPPDWEVMQILAKKYSKVNGFWRKDVGCTLPRKYRSRTCLKYACNLQAYSDKMTPANWLIRFFNGSNKFKWSARRGLIYDGQVVLPEPHILKGILTG